MLICKCSSAPTSDFISAWRTLSFISAWPFLFVNQTTKARQLGLLILHG